MSSKLLSSRSFHMLTDPTELVDVVTSLLELRRLKGILERPLIIWEPRPPSCVPQNREAFFAALKMVDVFSLNHIEVAKILGSERPEVLDRALIEKYASSFIDLGVGSMGSGVVVIRAGAEGCLIQAATQPPKWIPAFYSLFDRSERSEHVINHLVDPTGAGNAFLGSFAIGLLATGCLTEAALYGNVGASFAVEQSGLPQLEVSEQGPEVWNGVEVGARLLFYRNRLYPSLRPSSFA